MREDRFKRYQLNKKSSLQVRNSHPWVYSKNISSAASIFQDGQWLRLYDGENNVLGYGIYSKDAPISIRVFHFGENLRNRYFYKKLRTAMESRLELFTETNAVRLVHGENDGFPGVTVDYYNGTVVILFYSPSVYRLARLISFLLPYTLKGQKIDSILVKPAVRMGLSGGNSFKARYTRGEENEQVNIKELDVSYLVDLQQGQKGGFFLDLRGARRALRDLDLQGKRVLNLFSYTGAFSILAQVAGASEIISVDQSRGAQEVHRKNLEINQLDPEKDRLVCSDVFRYLSNLDESEKFDFIIFDPPSLAARTSQVPMALKKIEQMHQLGLSHLIPGCAWFSLCCTARIQREDFIRAVGKASKAHFGKGQTRLIEELPVEIDHKLNRNFPEGRYLTQLLFQAGE